MITLSDGTTVNIDGRNQPTLDIRTGVDSSVVGDFFFNPSDYFPFNPNSSSRIFNPNLGDFPTLSQNPTSADINVGTIVFADFFNNPVVGKIVLTNQYQPNLSLSGNIQVSPTQGGFLTGIATRTGDFNSGGAVTFDSRGEITINGVIQASPAPINFLPSGIPVYQGNGGNVTLLGNSNITLNSSIFANGLLSGNVRIKTNGDVFVTNGAFIDVAGGGGGNILIDAPNIELSQRSGLSAGIGSEQGSSESQAGNVTLNATQRIDIRQSSVIQNLVGINAIGNTGNITIQAGSLTVQEGGLIRTSIFGRGNAGNVNINVQDAVIIDGTETFIDVNGSTFTTSSQINSSLGLEAIGSAGNINLKAGSLFLSNGGIVNSSTFGIGDTGSIDISVNDAITIDGGNQAFLSGILSRIEPNGRGNGKDVNISANSISLTNGGQIQTSISRSSNNLPAGEGNAGNINLDVEGAVSLDGFGDFVDAEGSIVTFYSQILTIIDSGATGSAGNISVRADSVSLSNSGQISSSTFGFGDAGNIDITTDQIITIDGGNQGNQSGIFGVIAGGAVGNGKNINISANSIFLSNGGQIQTVVREGFDSLPAGQGNAGNVRIEVEDRINIDGIDTYTGNQDITEFVSSQIATTLGIETTGTAGNIDIIGNSISVINGGKITSSTLGQGNAGNISIMAEEQISMSGTFAEDLNKQIGGISAFTQTTGNAGNITIDTPQLTISDGAGIEAFTSGEGTAGNITINAPDSIILNTDTKLIVETSDAGTAGNININTPELTIGENAQLSATATETSTAPTAGNINLNVNQLNISGELGIFAETNSTPTAGSLTIQPYQTNPNLNIQFTENGFISARTTSRGDGGSITLTAPENIDISGLGSITAETSGSGNAGNINFDTANLSISDSTNITTSTNSAGNAGLITLNATESINLTNQAQITSEVRANATGSSEGIVINTPILTVNDNSQISAATSGEGNAGNITILDTENINLTNSNIIATTSGEGDTGEINLSASNNVNLDNSQINSSVETGGIGNSLNN